MIAFDISIHVKAQALTSELVNDHKPLQHRAVGCSIEHEVPGPHIIGMIRAMMIATVLVLV
jgi:hypothetical protein